MMSIPRTLKLFAPLLLILTAATNEKAGPAYTAEGAFIPPVDYREWVFLSSGIDMSYTESAAMQGHSMFDNVFVDPVAWTAFKRSGHWPDRTIFALEFRGANTKGSINKQGKYQTEELMGVEYHVHDESRFNGGWGFFAADGDKPSALIPLSAPCYSCHQTHGAVQTTFTQFYPTAKPIAAKAANFKEQ
jgi:hypothetical protein